ncbi:MAG: cytochrome C oxidase subunit II, partial [Snowella sp.]
GEYPIICAELCGSYHGGMKSMFYAQSEEDFNEWVLANAPAQPESEPVAQLSPADLSEGQFLAPYAKEMGISSATLAQIKSVVQDHKML